MSNDKALWPGFEAIDELGQEVKGDDLDIQKEIWMAQDTITVRIKNVGPGDGDYILIKGNTLTINWAILDLSLVQHTIEYPDNNVIQITYNPSDIKIENETVPLRTLGTIKEAVNNLESKDILELYKYLYNAHNCRIS